MLFCQNCGKQVPDEARVCPYCGTTLPVINEGAQPYQPAQQYQQPAQQYQQPAGQYQQPYQPAGQYQQQAYAQPQYAQAPPAAPLSPEADAQQSRGIAWLSYMGLLFLIPMFVKKASAFCRFHVKQGATIAAAEIAYCITINILLAIIGAIFPGETYYYGYYYTMPSGVYTVFSILLNLGYILFGVLSIMGIVAAASGKIKELPLVSKIPWIGQLIDKIYASLNK